MPRSLYADSFLRCIIHSLWNQESPSSQGRGYEQPLYNRLLLGRTIFPTSATRTHPGTDIKRLFFYLIQAFATAFTGWKESVNLRQNFPRTLTKVGCSWRSPHFHAGTNRRRPFIVNCSSFLADSMNYERWTMNYEPPLPHLLIVGEDSNFYLSIPTK